jgi:UDP-GlcNAc:undecaprenyl-phosphate GlcNAc-1-phosphate transferase
MTKQMNWRAVRGVLGRFRRWWCGARASGGVGHRTGAGAGGLVVVLCVMVGLGALFVAAASAGQAGGFGAGAGGLSLPAEPVRVDESADLSWTERLDVFHGHISVFVVSFLVTLLATPVCRRFAIANGIIDRPDEVRKLHKFPIAYLGGLAVFVGLLAGIAFSYVAAARPEWGLITYHESSKFEGVRTVPVAIVVGMTVVMLVGLFDDVTDIAPMQKVGGQLIAAAALAYFDIGTKLAAQVLAPIGSLVGNPALSFVIPGTGVQLDLVYWAGVVLIALFVLGACNASNLVDGLDGLLSGVTAIAGLGLLVIALGMAAGDDGPLDHTRIVLCMALIGACLGFLPHNFNPATIFLGDTGSLLLGFMTITIIMTLGDTGQTNLVLAGLVVYAVPIIDTSLAIVRRKLAGKKISEGDSDHLHHMLKRSLGVKGAAFSLYGLGIGFAVLGVLMTFERARVTYVLVLVMAAFIVVIAFKHARRKQFEEQALKMVAKPGAAVPLAAPPAGAHAPLPAHGTAGTPSGTPGAV